VLGNFRARALFILDEAHHGRGPAQRGRATQSTASSRAAVRGASLSASSNRLFLSADPAQWAFEFLFPVCLEILDPQRFTRGVPVRPGELDGG